MQNAAIFFHPDAFDTTGGRLLGRHSAGESFLRGFMRHADADRFHFWNSAGTKQDVADGLVERIGGSAKPLRWIGPTDLEGLRDPGVLSLPGPNLGEEAWRRRAVGASAYGICGLTHTTATGKVMGFIADLLIAPTEDYDALICTSNAVRESVETQLSGVREYLAESFGPRRRPEPQRVTIPLGINTDDYAVTAEQRRAWRERLNIPQDAAVALFVGRFNVRGKMNPALMAIALERAAIATGRPIYWVNSGWAETEEDAAAYHEQTRALCPSVTYIHVDGRPADVRFSIWSVADFFISFSDNIQETFGLTPIEAMAAGLPCVVTDWNGYKDSVRHGEDGFRIPTVAPRPGDGGDLAFWFANDWLAYTNYVGAAAQYTAIDYAAAVSAISILVTNPDFRRKLGDQARVRARSTFDWSAIIPQYQALWAEMDARRRAAPPSTSSMSNPFRPDPFQLFGGYPTRHIDLGDRLSLTPGMSPEAAWTVLESDLAKYARFKRPTKPEIEQVLAWLAENPNGSIGALMETFPRGRQPFVRRGLLWIARYGVIIITPTT